MMLMSATGRGKRVQTMETPAVRQGRAVSFEDVKPPVQPIFTAKLASQFPRAHPVDFRGALCPFVNEEQNSRLPWPLPRGAWRVRWRFPLTEGNNPGHILLLQAGNNVAATHHQYASLFDLEGHRVAALYPGVNGLFDTDHSLYWQATPPGSDLLIAYRMPGGELLGSLSVNDITVSRDFIGRRGLRMIMAGTSFQHRPDGGVVSQRAAIETRLIKDPPQADAETHLLEEEMSDREISIDSAQMIVAVHGDTVAFAVHGRLYFAGWDLRVRRALAGEFLPLAMSLDEEGRIYLVVASGNRIELWGIAQDGGRFLVVVLLSDADRFLRKIDVDYTHQSGSRQIQVILPEIFVWAPIIGYDHRVIVGVRVPGTQPGLWEQRLFAIGSSGGLSWEYSSSFAGAAVTADDRLLVSAGDKLLAFGETATPEVLHEFPGEIQQSAPILTGDGDLLVATGQFLYALTTHQ